MSTAISSRSAAPLSLAPAFGALAAGLLVLGLLFLPEGVAAVGTWNTSTAYGHCYLVLPMALYLAWDRREALAGVPLRAQPEFVLLALPVAMGWLVAERLGIMEGRQLMAVAAADVLFLVVLGWRVFKAMLGPFLYLFFLVPFGAFLTPALQQFTARFTVMGLHLLGIPTYSDDLIIEIPEGTFFVAEACAGLRFLIAAVAFGVFYALLNYRSWRRRAVFIGASLVVPVIANGFRALGIVVLGHVLGSAEAAAADHVIYGWVFFSFVMLLLVAAGLPLREAPAGAPPGQEGRRVYREGGSPVWAVLAACMAIAAGPAVARTLDGQQTPVPLTRFPDLHLPDGCRLRDEDGLPALPSIRAAMAIQCGGMPLSVSVHTFPARATASAVTAARRKATGELDAEDAEFSYVPVANAGSGAWSLVKTLHPFRTVASAAWVDGEPAPGGLRGRLHQARNSVLGGTHATVLMLVTAESDGPKTPEHQREVTETITKLVNAQPALTSEIEALSRNK